jgi:hypothetical protein
MPADTDVSDIVEPDLLADPTVVANFQPPGELHDDSGLMVTPRPMRAPNRRSRSTRKRDPGKGEEISSG